MDRQEYPITYEVLVLDRLHAVTKAAEMLRSGVVVDKVVHVHELSYGRWEVKLLVHDAEPAWPR